MAINIGNTTLPGVSGSMESVPSVRTQSPSPADVGLVGDANLTDGTAKAGSAYVIRTSGQAYGLFGQNSDLGQNVAAAIGAGAQPVYAAPATPTQVNAEDISASAETGTLVEGPVCTGDDMNVTFTVDGTVKTTIVTWSDPATITPGADEVYLNPDTKEYHIDVAPSTSGTADYEYCDYTPAIRVLSDTYGTKLDFLAATSANRAVVDEVKAEVAALLSLKEFAYSIAAYAPYIDFDAVDAPVAHYDSSRVTEFYPARNADGVSNVGAYAGLRAALGIDGSPMSKDLPMVGPLSETLTETQKETLVEGRIVPLQNGAQNPMVVDDLTTVSANNLDESDWTDSLSRLITDYVMEDIFNVSRPFIGELHDQTSRELLREIVDSRLGVLADSRTIVDYEVDVLASDQYTAEVVVAIETVKPLRNIVVNLTSGQIESGIVA